MKSVTTIRHRMWSLRQEVVADSEQIATILTYKKMDEDFIAKLDELTQRVAANWQKIRALMEVLCEYPADGSGDRTVQPSLKGRKR